MKNTNVIMKTLLLRFQLVALLLLCSTYIVHATSHKDERAMLSLKVKSQTVLTVLNLIEEKSDYNFFYNNNQIDMNRLITISSNKDNIFSVLDKVFENTNITYKVLDKSIILSAKTSTDTKEAESSITSLKAVQQDNKRITGVVLDASNDPIIGASVVVKGSTSLGTVTDFDGKFSLLVPEGSILTFSYIGYTPQEIVTVGKTTIDVVMKENERHLSEVVVTALGIKREEKALGYSVQRIGGDQISAVKGVDVASSLTGKVAGLQINNSSEISETPDLKLRGENPLIVIDGVPYHTMSLGDIGAEDIESLDILKGATASALYGERGKNGAVMITTKRGGAEGKLTINASNNTMFSAGYLKMPRVQNSYSTGNYGQLEYNSGNVWGDYMDGHEVMQYDPFSKGMKMMPLLSKGGNNVPNFLQSSLVSNSNVNISQAGKLGGFRLSATQVHQTGQYPNTKLDKYIVSGNGNIEYGKLKIDANFSYKKEQAPNFPKVNYGGGNILYNMLVWGGTEYDVRDFKDYWTVRDQKQNWPFTAWYDNPYYIVNERTTKWDKNIFTTSVNMNYEVAKYLSVIFRSGYENYNNEEENKRSMGDSGEKRGYYGFNNFTGSSFNNDLIINGNYTLNDFGFDYLAGVSSFWRKGTDLKSETRGGLTIPGFYSLNASAERPGVSKAITEKMMYGIYGKIGVSWKSGIYVDVTGRNDWSSTLPVEEQSYFYPSVSTSFLPTAFYNPIENILDFWKIRASWTVSKLDSKIYDLHRVYDITPDHWNGLTSSAYPNRLRDPNLRPEKHTSFEFGTDFRLFGGRLGFDLTYFTRLRENRILDKASISDATGFKEMVTNTSEDLKQKGMEFTLKVTPITNKDFTWETAFNGAFWHWYYDKIDPIYSSQDPRKVKGERVDKLFMTDWETDHAGNIVHQAGLPVKNKYETVMGYQDPSFILGWTNSFSYKSFDLNVSLDGRIGGLMYSWTEQAMWQSGVHPDSDNKWRYDEVVNKLNNYVGSGVTVVGGSASYDPYGGVIEDTRVFAPNTTQVSYQGYTTVYNENPWDHNARQNIKNASFIKLREVALNYTLPKTMSQKFFVQNARVGLVGQNLLMWTKAFKFSDPDRGKENLNTPTARYIGFNINLTL